MLQADLCELSRDVEAAPLRSSNVKYGSEPSPHYTRFTTKRQKSSKAVNTLKNEIKFSPQSADQSGSKKVLQQD